VIAQILFVAQIILLLQFTNGEFIALLTLLAGLTTGIIAQAVKITSLSTKMDSLILTKLDSTHEELCEMKDTLEDLKDKVNEIKINCAAHFPEIVIKK